MQDSWWHHCGLDLWQWEIIGRKQNGWLSLDWDHWSFSCPFSFAHSLCLCPPALSFPAPSSQGSSRSGSSSLRQQVLDALLPPIDPTVMIDIERHAKALATSADDLIENLSGTLHSVSYTPFRWNLSSDNPGAIRWLLFLRSLLWRWILLRHIKTQSGLPVME